MPVGGCRGWACACPEGAFLGTVAVSRRCPSRRARPGGDVSKVPLATVSVPKVPLATCSAGLTCPEGAPRDAGGPLGGPSRNYPPTGSEVPGRDQLGKPRTLV